MKSLSPWTIYGRAGSSTKQFAATPSRQPKTMRSRLSQGANWAERGGSATGAVHSIMLFPDKNRALAGGCSGLPATTHSWLPTHLRRFRHFTETPALSIENIEAREQIAFGFEAEGSDSRSE